jgi:hypothetical protein
LKKSEWSDKQLEELLGQLPKVKDRQNPDELYRKINARLQDDQVRRKPPKTWVLPSIAAVAAVLLIMVIGPSFLNFSGGSSQESAIEDSASEGEMAILENSENESTSLTKQEDQADIASTEESAELRIATSEMNHILSDTEGTFIAIGVLDDQASGIVPITFVSEDPEVSRVNLLEQALDQFPFEDYGLSPTPLSVLSFEEIDGNRIVITFPNTTMTTGSTISNEFYEGIQEGLRWMGYSEAILRTEDGSEVEIDQYGAVPSIKSPTATRGYFLYTSGLGSTYLVPGNNPSNTFKEAIEAMKLSEGLLQASVPANISTDVVEVDKDSVSITFSPDSTVNQKDLLHELMIKAILLTAKEFGYADVTFINTPEQIGGLNLKINGQPNPIPVPLAPNHIDFPITN